MEKLSV